MKKALFYITLARILILLLGLNVQFYNCTIATDYKVNESSYTKKYILKNLEEHAFFTDETRDVMPPDIRNIYVSYGLSQLEIHKQFRVLLNFVIHTHYFQKKNKDFFTNHVSLIPRWGPSPFIALRKIII